VDVSGQTFQMTQEIDASAPHLRAVRRVRAPEQDLRARCSSRTKKSRSYAASIHCGEPHRRGGVKQKISSRRLRDQLFELAKILTTESMS